MAYRAPYRVMHVAHSLGLGGTEKVMQLMACGLNPKYYEAAVFAFADGPRRGQIVDAGIGVFVGRDLLGALMRFRPHIVHVHRAGWPEPELLRTLRLAGVPAVVETNVFGRHDPSPGARVIDRHLFVSNFCAARYGRINGMDAADKRYRVLYNPVDTDFFAAHTPTPDFARQIFGRVSRADPGKWSRLALEPLPLIRAQLPDFRYRIIGGTEEAKRWVQARGLSANVEWVEPVDTDAELAAFYGSLSILAHANDTGESFGLVIAEAMAAGLPVITHPCPGLKDNAQLELVEHGVTGLVAKDSAEYAKALVHLLTHPDEAAAMGRRGRQKAALLFRAQTIVRRLEALYEEVLDEKNLTPVPDAVPSSPFHRLHQECLGF